MYPILILRSELVCLIILVFLYFTSRSYKINSESKAFNRILRFAVAHVLLDIATVLTVNHIDTVPDWLNWLCHIFFYLTAIFYSNEIANYVVAICFPQKAKKVYGIGHCLILLYIGCLSFLRIEYVADLGTYSSAGPAAIVGYGLAFAFFIAAVAVIFTHLNKMSTSIKSALIPMMLVLMISEICQIVWRSVLFTGGAITIVTVGFFFSLENPVAVFKKKAMTDALTGVRSRSSYEEDMERLDKQFKENPGEDHIFVFCDLNSLRNVNNRFGHDEGDGYITLIASAISTCMQRAEAVYRIGGDEFLVHYCRTDESVVESEIQKLRESCAKASEKLRYTAAVSAGYARSSNRYKSLRDVVKTADYAMYQNKTQAHLGGSPLKAQINYAGLTDKVFNAICASNDRSYPFITNLDTNVTRIAPGWREYFGLDSEFYADFNSVWKERIHPDYREGFMDDIVSVINGHRKYHHFTYLAQKADGAYVRVSCHGSVYHDSVDGTNFFTGFMMNYGMEENTDPVTGLQNYDVLTSAISARMDAGKPFSVLKLKLNNFAHVNMLYGYSEGYEVAKRIAVLLRRELGDRGEVFCQDSVNFTVLFYGCNEQLLKDYYKKISELCAAGFKAAQGNVPILLSGGAISNKGQRVEIEHMRGGLVYALEESQYYHRNNLVFYHELNDESSDADISLLAKIHADALGDREYFRLRYQPIVDSQSGNIIGAEALLRWIHPVYGEVPPSKFIAFIENDPCYYRLGLGIIEQAVKDAKKLQEKIPRFRMSINVTALQLQNDNFADNVFDILRTYDFDPGTLVLELTERCKEMDSEYLAKKIAKLRERGLLIAFDDLGTGYSTISLLMDIPVDEIKLDKNFVQDIANRENYRLFVKALVLGSAANHYTICFEGVENEATRQSVNEFGNFLAQGYLYSKPLLIEEFESRVEGKQ